MQVRCCFGGGVGWFVLGFPSAYVHFFAAVVAFQDVSSHLPGRGVAEAARSEPLLLTCVWKRHGAILSESLHRHPCWW
jgi:hypothetical protein